MYIDASPACAEVDPELFFPVTKVEIVNNVKLVKLICNGCSLLAACAKYAKDNPELQGIWAGKYQYSVGFKTANFKEA
jgi:hypothetical protein